MRFFKKLIPPAYQFQATSIKNVFSKFKQTHYSQNGEDIILQSYFPKEYRGFYVDVGAHHPYRISNTYLLFKRGWRGVNVDANPKTIEAFKRARPHDMNILCGVGKENGTATYHQFADPAVNTFSEADAEHWKKKTWNTYLGSTQIRIKPLREILDESMEHKQKIDILSVDVEGLDLDVLESNDWEKFRPHIVAVEDHTFDIEQKEKSLIYSFMKLKGYKLTDKLKFSLIFTEA